MLHVDENHPGAEELLKRRAFNVARSFIPRNTCAVDKKIISLYETCQIKRWGYDYKYFRYQQ